MVIVYARVSTTDQKLANQIELLKLAGSEKIVSRSQTIGTKRSFNDSFEKN